MELSAADITALLSNRKERGGMEREIRKVGDSLYVDLMETTTFRTKNAISVYGSATQNLKKLGDDFSHLRCVKKDNKVLIVNTKALAAAEGK